jgi:glycosyltransferase involved in cell wall biosynthesis
MKVCSVVFNTISRDARVLKEAASLREAGYDVTVIGLTDKVVKAVSETLDNGVKLVRVDPITIIDKIEAKIKRVLVLLGIILGVVAVTWVVLVTPIYEIALMLQLEIIYFLLYPFLIILFVLLAGILFWITLLILISKGSNNIINLKYNINRFYFLFKIGSFFLVILCVCRYIYLNMDKLTTQVFENQLVQLSLGVAVGIFIVSIHDYSIVKRYTISTLSTTKHKFRKLLAGKFGYLIKMLGLYLEARRIAPDVIHSHDAITLPIGAALKLTTRCLLIYDAHEIYEEVAQSSPRRAKIYRTIHRLCQRRVDGFVTINRSIAQWYAEHYPHLPPAVVVKNATNMAGPIDYDGRLHQATGLPPECKILLYQGGFSKKRGLEYLLEATRHLSDEWTLVMMGWGTLEDELRGVSEQINNERDAQGRLHAIVFIPPAPHQELALWTAGGTVGIIPYENIGLNHWFCTPNKLWEYPNAALPVLVSPFPELSAPVLEYGFGWLLPEDQEPQALGQLIMSLGSEQIAEARANCGVFMQADNWQFYAEKLVDLYRSLEPRIVRSNR